MTHENTLKNPSLVQTETTTVGILGDVDWNSMVQIEDFMLEIMETEEELHGESHMITHQPTLIVRQTGSSGAEDMSSYLGEKHGWNVEVTRIPDAKTALSNYLRKTDIVLVLLKNGANHILPEKELRKMQKTEEKLRIKVG